MVANAQNKRAWTGLFWGRMADMEMSARVASLVFVAATIVAMSFCQIAVWPIGAIDGKIVYLMLMLAPLLMGALMFGPITGALLGLLAGAVQFAHAAVFPLDYYEYFFMNPLNTFLLLTFLGLLSGWLFNLVYRKTGHGGVRMALICVLCLALSALTSLLVSANTALWLGGPEFAEVVAQYLLPSPMGIAVQAIIDAAAATILCLAADAVVRRAKARGDDRTLLSVFRNWMVLVAGTVFLLACSIIFSVATVQSEDSVHEDMISNAQYLAKQAVAFESADYEALLDGYDTQLDGYVVITDEAGTILATDDPKYPEGGSLVDLLGYGSDQVTDAELATEIFGEIAEGEEVQALEEVDENGVSTMNYLHVAASAYDTGYVVVMQTANMVYRGRAAVMLSSTLIAMAMIIAIAILATILLKQVVVRRIGETNESLEKITGGNLNERVGVHDSREFTSLSTGINTTVAALKDTIEEVKQRNAQDLATAKAIQESALPTEFPAFPDIDKFDIYASMKTAKEVGGDFYDFFLVDGTTKLAFIMADVSGKGIPAALFMMTAKTQLRNHLQAELPLGEAVNEVNHQLCIGNDAGMFVTAWVAALDYETGALEYVNAGHNPPMLLHDGAWTWLKDVSGMPLGLFDGIPYDPFTLQLVPGDMVYTYTDGVTEAMNPDDELFGEDRLEKVLAKFARFNPRSVCVGVRRALTDFTLDAEQSDDITMLGLKYGVPPEEKAVMILDARTDQLVHVCNYIHAELHRRRAPKSVYNPLDIAAEELFVNVCHYAYPDATPENPGQVRISFEYQTAPSALAVQIADDGIPYNPLAKPDAVTPTNIEDVPIGGLGILMAKRSVDEMIYERIGESNVLTFKKSW